MKKNFDETDLDEFISSRAREIDSRDLRILAELDLNARTTNSEIAKKLGMTSNAVKYRVDNLEESGVIKGYDALIDAPALGYLGYRIYLKFQYANSKTRKEIVEYFNDCPLTWWTCAATGRFDLVNIFWVKNARAFEELLEDFKGKYSQYIKEFVVIPYFGFVEYGFPFTKSMLKEKKGVTIGSGKIRRINPRDWKILRMLSFDARTPLSKISKEVGLSAPTVKYRINKLIENKIILGFRPEVDMEKLGYNHCKIDFNLRSPKCLEMLKQRVLNDEHVDIHMRTASQADLEVGAYFRSSKELHGMIGEIQDEFPDEIQYYELYIRSKLVKDSLISCF
jgi:DNA-binding Lrp family transcriptional regulator